MVLGTREKIINAFFKLAKKYPDKTTFSLTEIAAQAGISRQAIYRNHFNNTKEITNYIFRQIDHDIFEKFSAYDPLTDGNPLEFFKIHIIPALYNLREWLDCLYSTSIGVNWRKYLCCKYEKWLADYSEATNSNWEISNESARRFIVNSVISIIDTWITDEDALEPKDFQEVFEALVTTPLTNYFEK